MRPLACGVRCPLHCGMTQPGQACHPQSRAWMDAKLIVGAGKQLESWVCLGAPLSTGMQLVSKTSPECKSAAPDQAIPGPPEPSGGVAALLGRCHSLASHTCLQPTAERQGSCAQLRGTAAPAAAAALAASTGSCRDEGGTCTGLPDATVAEATVALAESSKGAAARAGLLWLLGASGPKHCWFGSAPGMYPRVWTCTSTACGLACASLPRWPFPLPAQPQS